MRKKTKTMLRVKMKEKNDAERWLNLLKTKGIQDIPAILDQAPPEIDSLRGAWENPDFSTLIRCAAAVSFLEGVIAAHPTLLLEV